VIRSLKSEVRILDHSSIGEFWFEKRNDLVVADISVLTIFMKNIYYLHCKVIIGRNPIEANANTVAIQLPGNPVAYIGKCFTPY